MDPNTFDMNRADAALKNAREDVVAAQANPLKPVTPVDPSISRAGAQPVRTSAAQFPRLQDSPVAIGRMSAAQVGAVSKAPADSAPAPVASTIKRGPSGAPILMDFSAVGGTNALLPPIVRGAYEIPEVIRNVDAMIPTPANPMGRTYDEAKAVRTPVEPPAAIARTPAPAPIPATPPETRGYVEVNGKREYIDGSSQFGVARPASVRVGTPEEMEQFRRLAGGAPATSDASAVARPGAQVPDITIPEFGEREPTAQLTWAGATRSQEQLAAQIHAERLRGYNERLLAHQTAVKAAALAKAGFTNEQAMEILRGGTQRDVATINETGRVNAAKAAGEAKTAYQDENGNWIDPRRGIQRTDPMAVKQFELKHKRLTDALEGTPRMLADGKTPSPEYQDIQRQLSELEGGAQDIPVATSVARPGAASYPEANEALAWAKANPKDPRSAAILKKLGVQGRPSNVDEAMVMAKKSGAKSFTFGGKNYQVQ